MTRSNLVPEGYSFGKQLTILCLGIILAMTSGLGCGPEESEGKLARRDAELTDVPEVAMTAAQDALPSIEFDEVWQNVDGEGELHSYELRGKDPETGKTREVRVNAAGQILEME